MIMKYLEEKENLKDLVKNGIYIVDFYAEWCGPCKMLALDLEELENVNIIKVDIDKHMDLTREYGVMSVPTLLYVKDGVIKNKTIGYISKEEIEENLKAI